MSYAECHYTDCHYADCNYAHCQYAECHEAECHWAEWCYAECRLTERRGAILIWPQWFPIMSLKENKVLLIRPLSYFGYQLPIT